jgi:Rrf2 family protein
MKRNRQLSMALHVLLHLGGTTAIPSEALATRMGSHAVVMRRTMAGLRRAGIVRSEKGHGGGWTLARPLEDVTLADVYDALGMPQVLAMENRTESPGCLVERAVNGALSEAFAAAEAVLLARFRSLTLAELSARIGPLAPHETKKKRGESCST